MDLVSNVVTITGIHGIKVAASSIGLLILMEPSESLMDLSLAALQAVQTELRKVLS